MKITLSRLGTKDLATLAQRIISSSQSGNYTIVTTHPLLSSVQTAYAQYDEVYAKLAFSGKGKDVAKADKDRDIAYRNLKAFLNGYRKLPSAPNYELAADLYKVFETYGLDIDEMSYSKETAQMKKLIEDLEKPENVQKLSALSITVAFNEMKDKQLAFEALFAEQAEANANLRQTKSATQLRKDLEKSLKDYLNLITAMKDIQGWKTLYLDLNELVKAAKNSNINRTYRNNTDSQSE